MMSSFSYFQFLTIFLRVHKNVISSLTFKTVVTLNLNVIHVYSANVQVDNSYRGKRKHICLINYFLINLITSGHVYVC
jgi:hypothetical protein